LRGPAAIYPTPPGQRTCGHLRRYRRWRRAMARGPSAVAAGARNFRIGERLHHESLEGLGDSKWRLALWILGIDASKIFRIGGGLTSPLGGGGGERLVAPADPGALLPSAPSGSSLGADTDAQPAFGARSPLARNAQRDRAVLNVHVLRISIHVAPPSTFPRSSRRGPCDVFFVPGWIFSPATLSPSHVTFKPEISPCHFSRDGSASFFRLLPFLMRAKIGGGCCGSRRGRTFPGAPTELIFPDPLCRISCVLGRGFFFGAISSAAPDDSARGGSDPGCHGPRPAEGGRTARFSLGAGCLADHPMSLLYVSCRCFRTKTTSHVRRGRSVKGLPSRARRLPVNAGSGPEHS